MSVPPEVSVNLSTTSLRANFRPGVSLATTNSDLGPLADLAGTWVGTGLNLISLPDFDSRRPSTGPAAFRLKLNSTVEILEFTPIGAGVPNRGVLTSPPGQQPATGQPDINIFGLRYLQRVADAVTHEPLHIEPGFWLNLPSTVVPVAGPTVVRQGAIPHGTSLLALGPALPPVPSGPQIGDVDSTPTNNPDIPPPLGPEYLMPFTNPPLPLPPGFEFPFIKNPNLALKAAIQGQNIIQTVMLPISTAPVQFGGIVNMPFDVSNANATSLSATFWIETVQNPDDVGPFLQLQYTQTVILNFLGIDWPHISVATLIKQ